MTRLIALLLGAFVLISCAFGARRATPLADAYFGIRQSLASRDADRFGGYLSPDFVWVIDDSRTVHREEVLAGLRQDLRMQGALKPTLSCRNWNVGTDSATVDVSVELAVWNGKSCVRSRSEQHHTWVRMPEGWRLSEIRILPAPAPEFPMLPGVLTPSDAGS